MVTLNSLRTDKELIKSNSSCIELGQSLIIDKQSLRERKTISCILRFSNGLAEDVHLIRFCSMPNKL